MQVNVQPKVCSADVAAKHPRLFVVVLNWNGMEDLIECLCSVQRSTYKNEIIVVDNGSTDASVITVSGQFPDVDIIETGNNLGFGANNLGISQALQQGADYVLLLNNDTWVDPQCFDRLMKVAEEHPRAGILSPRICYYSDPELIWYDGGNLEKVNGFWQHQHVNENSSTSSVPDRSREVDYISGCAMLIRKSVIERIGGLDARFFMYWEDGDFSLRARNVGFQLLHVPSATVLHKVSRSSGGGRSPDVRYYMERNRYFLAKKTAPFYAQIPLLRNHIRKCFWQYCALMEESKADHALAVSEAAWDSLIGRGGQRRGKVPLLVLNWLEKRRRCSNF